MWYRSISPWLEAEGVRGNARYSWSVPWQQPPYNQLLQWLTVMTVNGFSWLRGDLRPIVGSVHVCSFGSRSTWGLSTWRRSFQRSWSRHGCFVSRLKESLNCEKAKAAHLLPGWKTGGTHSHHQHPTLLPLGAFSWTEAHSALDIWTPHCQ